MEIETCSPNDSTTVCQVCGSKEQLEPLSLKLKEVFEMIIKNSEDEIEENLQCENVCKSCVLILEKIENFILKCKNNEPTLQIIYVGRENRYNDSSNTGCDIINCDGKMDEVELLTIEDSQSEMIESQVIHDSFPSLCRICLMQGDLAPFYLKLPGIFETIISSSEDEIEENFLQNVCENCTSGLQDMEMFIQKCRKNAGLASKCEEMAIKASNFMAIKRDKTYECIFCNSVFRYVNTLKRHFRTHDLEKDYKCRYCKGDFFAGTSLVQHIDRYHTDTNLFAQRHCPHCDRQFYTRKELYKHILAHTDEKLRKCSVCEKTFLRSSGLSKHMLVHYDSKPYACSHCGKGYRSRESFKQHLSTHTNEGDDPFTCPHCDIPFETNRRLQIHMKAHTENKPSFCRYCSGEFYDETALLNHTDRRHPDVKPTKKYQCLQCVEQFDKKMELKVHLAVHTGERPFKCTLCDKAFFQAHRLTDHLKVHSDERPFSCTHCAGVFKSGKSLKKHLRTHVTEEFALSHICSHCNKGFCEEAGALEQDEADQGEKLCPHCGKVFLVKPNSVLKPVERSYKCELCGKSFICSTHLKTHMRVHTGEKPFACVPCGKAYQCSSSLKKHLQRH